MLDECSGFYRVFKYLKQIAFLKTNVDEIGIEQFDENEQLVCPCIVCGIFAAELALKYLIFRKEGKIPQYHDIQELYTQLPDEHRRIIQNRLEKGKRLNYLSVGDEINRLKNHFVKWRYSYEFHKELQADIFIETFVEIVCDYVLGEQRPSL